MVVLRWMLRIKIEELRWRSADKSSCFGIDQSALNYSKSSDFNPKFFI
jgi:hypothetical protein